MYYKENRDLIEDVAMQRSNKTDLLIVSSRQSTRFSSIDCVSTIMIFLETILNIESTFESQDRKQVCIRVFEKF
ncbi:hypothetical protein V1478_003202 [Vespula squamosa]|uniref:Uncharacterized protein n=1 Tax=Vespula squamosa TaxID=30214 RepID=A0ABD2BS14_VESSQ